MKIILASTSKYRRELLQRLGIPFEVEAPDVDESSFHKLPVSPRDLAATLALKKAKAVQALHPDAIIIGSDQVAAIDGEVLGKPGSVAAAIEQLSKLTGREHELFTAVCMLAPEKSFNHVDITLLQMESLGTEALKRYVVHDMPTDCAGSYKIESQGIALFRRIQTEDATAIQGLPLITVARILRQWGVVLP